ncbi:sodium:glutamate symporter [Pyruvatibacter sp.]|uniref:sodium/glutamate symporter n=1 Tax=Pyruvatibacter sp. TaxID=1981328 RepID=UPI003265D426
MGDVEWFFMALTLIWVLLIAAQYVRRKSQILSSLFLPGSIIAGLAALVAGPDGLGTVVEWIGPSNAWPTNGIIPAPILETWHTLPGILINVVFAALFLGKTIPGLKSIWRRAAPVITYGQTIAWGQYVIGLLLAILVLTPVFGMNPMAGALIEIGFEGGHGTAAGLIPVFEELDFAEGADLALGLATVGLLSAIISGTILINWAARTNRLSARTASLDADAVPNDMAELMQNGGGAQQSIETDPPIDPLSFHLGLIGISILLGWLMLQALIGLERMTWGHIWDLELITHMPIFPFAMIGGVIVQVFATRWLGRHAINRDLINRIAGTALDIIIVAALATLSLAVIGDNLVPFALLAIAGASWNIIGFLVLAPRLIPRDWFENGIPNFGQSMGMTVTGMLLFRMTDPNNRSGGLESFGYKQLLFEPVVGGGLFTASAMPLIMQFGAPTMLVVTGTFMLAWLAFGLLVVAPAGRARG